MSRIKIITGHFGSGKTEVAVNLAMQDKGTTIVDLDTVNPYFRTADAKEELERHGIRAIVPEFANTNLDLPTLPPEIYSVFQNDGRVIFDVGGDDDGALALGMYHNYFQKENPDMYFVVCTTRPLMSTADDVIEMIRNIEAASRLRVTHLINNTHLSKYTEIDTVLKGQAVTEEVSRKTGIPILFTAVREDLKDKIADKIGNNVLGLKLYLNLPF
ncbi:MAG: ATP-binding protein [Clostridia bacterium]|nr:ATP-binding protein [Clostridia bacterium]